VYARQSLYTSQEDGRSDDQTDAKPPAPTSSCSTTRTFYNISFEASDERGPIEAS
jgi:hypothetical protein